MDASRRGTEAARERGVGGSRGVGGRGGPVGGDSLCKAASMEARWAASYLCG